jgi:alpha-glucosidase
MRANGVTNSGDWWRSGVLYQVYPRSFTDTNNDGIGDLNGITSRLDYLSWLGVSGIWLNPVTPSANEDWGYDVTDYCDVDQDLGTLADLENLVRHAGDRGIHVLLDLVPNHTSSQHPWFIDARSSRTANRRDWYIWADGRHDGTAPNNWLSVFGGPAWTYDERTAQFYLHNFMRTQPDLNWRSDEVRAEFHRISEFWFQKGIAGFRLDVAYGLIKDERLRDNPPATDHDLPVERRIGQRQIYNMYRPEVHEVLRAWRALADAQYPPRILAGEVGGPPERVTTFHGTPAEPELNLTLAFPFADVPFEADALRTAVEDMEVAYQRSTWPSWQISSHDVPRAMTRWCRRDPARMRCALMILLTLRGTPVIYYGDEIGMGDADVQQVAAQASAQDQPRKQSGRPTRMTARTPMRWQPGHGAGFTSGRSAWLPVGTGTDVATQRSDRLSILWLCRDLIGLRARSADLVAGSYRSLQGPTGTWLFQRGARTVIAVNLTDKPARIDHDSGVVVIGTDRRRDRQRAAGGTIVRPFEGLVIKTTT